jgi:hypothetical protein
VQARRIHASFAAQGAAGIRPHTTFKHRAAMTLVLRYHAFGADDNRAPGLRSRRSWPQASDLKRGRVPRQSWISVVAAAAE